MSRSSLHSQTRFPHAPETFAGIAAGIALLALIGWLSGRQVLAGEWSAYVPTAPSTALGLLLLSAALFCCARWPASRTSRLFCLIATSIVFLLGLVILGQFLLGIDPGIEQIVFGASRFLGSTPLGRMSPISAAAFLMESAALFLSITKRGQPASVSAVVLTTGATGFNIVVLMGYAFGAPLLYGGTIIPIALPSACAFVLVGVGEFMLAAPGVPALRDWSGTSMRGILLRAFLPVILFYVVFDNWFDTQFPQLLASNPAVWDSLKALSAGVLVIIVIGWIARRTGIEIERAQAALAENEEQYRLLFENSGEAIIFTQPDGTIYSANPEACRMFGRSEDEIKKNGRAGIVAAHESRLQAAFGERLRTGRFKGELTLVRKDGTFFPGDISAMSFKDSHGEERISLVIRDLTERKQGEMRLVESEVKFRSVFEHSPLGKSLTGLDGSLSVNQAFSDMLGYSEEEARTKKWQELTHPDDVQKNLDAMRGLLDGKISRAHFEKRYIHKNGNLVWTDVVTVLERDENGDPLYFLTTISDIGERKRAEETLQRSLEQITHGQNTLRALSLAAQAAQRAHTPQAIYQAVGKEIKKLGFEMIILDLHAEKKQLSVGFITYAAGPVRAAETLTGISVKAYRFPLIAGGHYDQLLSAGKAILYPDAKKITAEVLPAALRPLSGQVLKLLGTGRGIYGPLVVQDQTQGFLVVMGSELDEADLPAVDLLTSQVAIALENARLFQAIQLELAERKRADEALRESEKRFRALIENSSDAVTLLDAAGTVLYDSPAAPGMLGYGPDELIGQNGFTLIHPDDVPRIRQLFQNLGKTPGARATDIFRLHHKSGAWLWVETVAKNLLTEPAVKAVVLNYRDITARIGAEAALQESEERYRLLVETLPDGVVVHSQGQVVFANAASAAIIGAASTAELTGKPVIGFVHPDYREMALKRIQQSLASGVPLALVEEKFVRLDGTAIDVEVAAIPFSFAGKPAMLTVFNDITNRKQGQEALRESEEKFRNTIQEAGEGIVICDEQFRIVEWNKSQETIFGLSRAQMVGTLLWDFQYSLLPAERKTDEAYQELKRNMLTIWQSDNTAWMNRAAELQVVNAAGERKTLLHTPFSITTGRGTLYASLTADITDRKHAEEKIRRQLAYVTALSEIDRAISSGFDLQLSLDTLLVHVIAQLNVDAADILLFDPGTHTLEYAAGQGFHAQAIENIPIPLSKGHAAHAILNQRPVFIPDLEKQPDETPRSALFVSENFASYYAVPLRAKGELNGVLEVFQRSPLEPDQEWLVFLNTIAGQAGIAIDHTTLFKSLQRSNIELSLAYDATIEGWSHALDLRDKETEGHTQRVTEMTLELALSFKLTPDELTQVRRGALLHDIGKMGVPDGILLKPGELTDEEWLIMKKHPIFAYEMLAPIGYLHAALDIPYCHHEKWDGSGYPRGLKGEQIPLAARIFAVVDVWDALHSDRPYRPAWPAKKVQDHIRSLAGTHFDPHVVDIFLKSSIFTRFK